MSASPEERRCTLHRTLDRAEVCPGCGCPFWSRSDGACVLHGVEFEILCRPPLAEHLLELRASLDAASPPASSR